MIWNYFTRFPLTWKQFQAQWTRTPLMTLNLVLAMSFLPCKPYNNNFAAFQCQMKNISIRNNTHWIPSCAHSCQSVCIFILYCYQLVWYTETEMYTYTSDSMHSTVHTYAFSNFIRFDGKRAEIFVFVFQMELVLYSVKCLS